MHFENQKKAPSVVLFVLTLLGALLIGVFFTYSKIKQWNTSRKNLSDTSALLDERNTQQNGLIDAINQMSDQADDLSSLSNSIPDAPDTAALYAYLESLADSNNITITSMQGVAVATADADNRLGGNTAASAVGTKDVDTSTPSARLGAVIVYVGLLPAKGDGPQSIVDFMTALQSSKRFMDIQNLDISNDKDGVAYRLTFKTYYEITK